ncbi:MULTISPECIES: hypothetical protein [Lacticaseibacillus]|uniref:Uncharacterized protein n=1 Tax=Lacticaseibacillus zeae subsp. silagei TaxID=3068307 RepID=A0ABD7Z5Z1_LACZE|nr:MULTISPECIES: hypothetical protein [Lacticaseibacillus]OFS01077.1 hypothetical protein HMPREF2861_03220 [Lactobacillus sp. HMSC068F07]MDE3282587.1 hypothetical protein [Lacticaseibacillus casei]MDE3315387.1 hypothetical protein [Lacticaseibacillus zeae]WLV82452.1 hypothetical protein LACZS2_001613 [Lacticaseibacillus sp. NCIMB 15475]WLV85102.1 hypothetical protein LACZS1_001465 [Lacticaseibacillus sp. NCIMB 15474]
MENKSSALQSVTQHLVASYREIFDLATPTARMPMHQVDLFIDQAMQRHYKVALFFNHESSPFVGHIIRTLGKNRFLVKAYHSNVFRVMTSTSVNFIKRFD